MHPNFNEKKIFITGHTGFKGTWLSLWLKKLGAEVTGYSLSPPESPNLFSLVHLENHVRHLTGDIRDLSYLTQAINHSQAEIVFHLAAQSLVIEGFEHPQETFAVNALGTVNLLEACRHSPHVKAVVIVTTDKCYANRSWIWGYRENDRLGGNDPYSSSKAMAELAVAAYRSSYFSHTVQVATARAGNVIGGGDFSKNRLVPDCMQALMQKQPIPVRNPHSVRPWLHVLDPLNGYLSLADRLLSDEDGFAEAWNFGPLETNAVSVKEVVEEAIHLWGEGHWVNTGSPHAHPEMETLTLNWDKAAHKLPWRPRYNWKRALEETVSWYQAYENSYQDLYATCMQQIESYENHTRSLERGLPR
jgi:CDP-glucose 4,6-dehydratase